MRILPPAELMVEPAIEMPLSVLVREVAYPDGTVNPLSNSEAEPPPA